MARIRWTAEERAALYKRAEFVYDGRMRRLDLMLKSCAHFPADRQRTEFGGKEEEDKGHHATDEGLKEIGDLEGNVLIIDNTDGKSSERKVVGISCCFRTGGAVIGKAWGIKLHDRRWYPTVSL
jgi:hypothetical protein